MIDLPQIIDVISNPRGGEFLDRDATNIARWFEARGLSGCDPEPSGLAAVLRAEAGLSAA
jgi:RIO kinase 1